MAQDDNLSIITIMRMEMSPAQNMPSQREWRNGSGNLVRMHMRNSRSIRKRKTRGRRWRDREHEM